MSSTSTARNRSAGLPVLFVDSEVVEWGTPGAARPHSRTVTAPGPRALAQAAAQLAAEVGSPRACVLALGSALAKHRLLTLPRLSRAEVRAVITRKAAHLAECDAADVAYAAHDFGVAAGAPNDVKSPEHRWLVAAMRRSLVRELCLELRAVGIHVKRVVSAPIASLAAADEMRVDREKACIVVAAHPRTTTVAVLAGDGLHVENVLEGNVRTAPALSMGIVQEIKSNDAAWRKSHRGSAIEEVVLLGLPHDRLPLFQTAVQTALPGARVIVPEAGASAQAVDADPGRMSVLDACRSNGLLQLELTLPLPARRATVVASLVVLFGLVGGAGVVGFRTLRARELAEATSLQRLAETTRELETLRTANDTRAAELAALAATTARNELVLRDGWDLRGLLGDVLTAFGADARLTSVTLGGRDDGADVVIVGRTSADPGVAMSVVDRIVREIRTCGRFADATAAEPASGVPDGREPVSFTLRTVEERHP